MLTHDWPTLDVLRLRYIARVLERAGGNKTRAADMLGIDRRTLNRILARERARQAAAARNYRPLVPPGQAPRPLGAQPGPQVPRPLGAQPGPQAPRPLAAQPAAPAPRPLAAPSRG